MPNENDQKPLRPRTRITSPASRATLPIRQAPPEIGRFHQYRGSLLLILAALVLWMNLTFLVPLVMGSIFAIVLYPLMNKLARWRVSNLWKAAAVTTAFAISFLLPLGSVMFLGAEQALVKIQHLQEQGLNAMKLSPSAMIEMFNLRPLIDQLSDVTSLNESQLRQFAGRGLASLGAFVVQILQGTIATLPGAVFSTMVVLITIFFLLIDGRKAVRFLKENSFFGPHQTQRIFESVSQLCYSVVVASIAAGAVQSLLILLSCLITRTEGALLISLIAFVLSFLPVLGTAPVTIFLAISALIAGDYFAAVIFVTNIVIVGLSDNIVRPYVLKGGASLHPLVGFVAAFGALDAIGFYGVFIGPVVAGLFFNLLPLVTRSYRTPNKTEIA